MNSISIAEKKPRVVMLCGMVGSGKSTLARQLEIELHAVRFSPDEWMIDFFGEHMSREDFDKRMVSVKEKMYAVVQRLVALNINAILDFGFWKRLERVQAITQIQAFGGEPVVYFLDVTKETLIERIEKRNRESPAGSFQIDAEMLDLFTSWFEAPSEDECPQFVKFGAR